MKVVSAPLDRDSLIAAIKRGERFEYLFFWDHTGKTDVPGK
jgi:hypothetical protein